MTDRIAYWVDLDDPYITYTNDYLESCWWILKTLWDARAALPRLQGDHALPALCDHARRP